MPNIGWQELLLILLVVLLLFGAKRLPEVGKALGKGIREFKNAMRQIESDLDENEEKEQKKVESSDKAG